MVTTTMVTAVLLAMEMRQVPPVVTQGTLCMETLPMVPPERSPSMMSFPDRARLHGPGAIRIEAGTGAAGTGPASLFLAPPQRASGSIGVALYFLTDRERVPGHIAIDFGIYLDGKGAAFVREFAVGELRVADYVPGDIFEIAIADGAVRYLKNGDTVHVSTTVPRFPLEPTGCSDGTSVFHTSNEWAPAGAYNNPPIAVGRASRRRFVGQPIRFDASRSTDANGKIRRYRWDFGDGKRAEGVTVEHVYADAGQYAVKLRVVDDWLEPAETSFDMMVEWPPDPPTGPGKP